MHPPRFTLPILFWGIASLLLAAPPALQTAKQLDQILATKLFTPETKLAPRTNDATFLRRVWLDIVGDLPTPEHLTAFALDPDPNKRDTVVQELLANEQYGQNWARYWRDVILYRKIEDRAEQVSNPLVVLLTKSFNENESWDKIASRFITAKGDVKEHGETAIIFAQEGRTEETTAEMARIFLGIQIQCAQCHDHPYDRWKRDQFHELAAFFPRIGLRPVVSATRRSFEVVTNDAPERRFRPKANVDRPIPEPEHYMPDLENPTAKETRMEPKFFLTSAKLSPGATDAERREKVAQWFTDNEWFAAAYVNRIWGELVGEGFYEPIDDVGPDRKPSAPEAIDFLANQFAKSNFDGKWLIRTICATEAYQRESRPRREISETPFTANVAQRLRGDQLFNALLTALDASEEDQAAGGRGRRLMQAMQMERPGQYTPRAQFDVAFGYDPSEPRDSISQSIPQALAMMNTPKINVAIHARPESMLGKLLMQYPDDEMLVSELYLRTLSREPTGEELDRALAYRETAPSRREAVEDVFWAILNCSEFTHRR